jgi:pyrroloquinoline quinone biosynthesis protein B
MHASLAVSASCSNWYLINATPDIRFQIESRKELHPGPALRESPVKGVLLTDAELDHTIGLLNLREGASFTVFATDVVMEAISTDFPIVKILGKYANIQWNTIALSQPFDIDHGLLTVQAFKTGTKRPRYVNTDKLHDDWVVGYIITERSTGRSLVYAPAVERWHTELESMLSKADCIMFDGTFWSEDELEKLSASKLSAQQMGHLPVGGTEGSAHMLAKIDCSKKILVHINNTNPILDQTSKQARELSASGIEIGKDSTDLKV